MDVSRRATGTGAMTATERAWAVAIVQALPMPVLLVDTALVLMAANDAARALLHLGPAEEAGRPLARVLTAQDESQVRRAAQAISDGRGWQLVTEVVQADGTRQPVGLRGEPLRPGGAVEGALVTLVPQGDQEEAAAAALSDELTEALRGDQIVLYYQPIVRLADGRPVAAEALVRWEHPRRGLLPPSEFLAVADTAALAAQLNTRVLRQACHAAGRWRAGPSTGSGVRVAVNLSERQLLQPGTAAVVREALSVAGCPPEQLLLEVSEGALLRDPDAALRALSAVKELGVGIAIDDLGTGSSPLSYLNRFPVEMVKIDRSLVAGLGQDPEQNAVVASLVSMAQALGVPCVAEGVETADQLTVLRQLDCDLAQGYLFSRAMTEQSTTEWLTRAVTPRRRGRVPTQGAEVDPQTVERALELQAQGASLHTLAARLNAEGHRNVGGRRWHHTSVAQLIAAHKFPDLAV